jgi:hypothetical protein
MSSKKIHLITLAAFTQHNMTILVMLWNLMNPSICVNTFFNMYLTENKKTDWLVAY